VEAPGVEFDQEPSIFREAAHYGDRCVAWDTSFQFPAFVSDAAITVLNAKTVLPAQYPERRASQLGRVLMVPRCFANRCPGADVGFGYYPPTILPAVVHLLTKYAAPFKCQGWQFETLLAAGTG